MTNKQIFKIYRVILITFVIALIASVLIPFSVAKSLISVVWGENATLPSVASSVILNLLYGLISSTVLALFISFITYQHDILREEAAYYSDVKNIAVICRNSLSRQDIIQIERRIEMHKEHSWFISNKPYKKSFLHYSKTKKELPNILRKVEDTIIKMGSECVGIRIVTEKYDANERKWGHNCAKLLYLSVDANEYQQCSANVKLYLKQMEELEASKDERLERISSYTDELDDLCKSLRNYLHYECRR